MATPSGQTQAARQFGMRVGDREFERTHRIGAAQLAASPQWSARMDVAAGEAFTQRIVEWLGAEYRMGAARSRQAGYGPATGRVAGSYQGRP